VLREDAAAVLATEGVQTALCHYPVVARVRASLAELRWRHGAATAPVVRRDVVDLDDARIFQPMACAPAEAMI
jgi:hypothetical protein